jgi:histidinol-phosphate aminotransferase
VDTARLRQSSCDQFGLAAPGVQKLQPYQPGKPISELEREYGVSEIIKLASNENPLGFSRAALRAMERELRELAFYPDGGGFSLKTALAGHHSIDPACITLGNGSNDVLVLLAEAFLAPGLEAVFSNYCFAVYPLASLATGATPRIAPALSMESAQPLGHDLTAMHSLIGTDTRLVFIANPNNPTGTWLEAGALYEFVSSVPDTVLVIVDEAYHEYSQNLGVPDATSWLEEFPNLVVTRTFSKAYGLAGIRVGYSLSSPQVANLLNRVRQPFNVNSIAMAGAQAAIGDQAFIDASVTSNTRGIRQLTQGLEALGFEVTPSAANFVLADMGQPTGPVYKALLQRGIIVRPVGNYGLPNHLRITAGTAEQNDLLLRAYDELAQSGLLHGA